jgi:hypothetical protein
VDVTVGVVRPEVICILRMMVYVSFVVGILIQIQLVIVVLVGVAGTADVVIVQNVTNLHQKKAIVKMSLPQLQTNQSQTWTNR